MPVDVGARSGAAETRSQAAKVDEAIKPLNSMDSKLDRIAEALERRASRVPFLQRIQRTLDPL
jgi:hypothetical protein